VQQRPGQEPGKKKSRFLWSGAVVAVVVALAVGGVWFFTRDKTPGQPAGRTLAQYDFKFVAPQDWVQTDDRVAERQVVIHPQDFVSGGDLVVAQEYVMDYDATADRQKLVDELQTSASRYPDLYSRFDPNLTYAGKTLIGYHEVKPKEPGLQVDWYVVAKGRIRVHIGCQYSAPELKERVSAACTQAVRTVEVTS